MSNSKAPSKYFAFLSYSHSDITYARRLHARLEAYDITTLIESPKKQTIFPVCRDETAFSTGKLDSVIHQKLDESKKLIVICSHTAAISPYVTDEVNYFAEHSGIENIIPIISEPYENIKDVLPGVLKEHADILCIDRFGYAKKDDGKMFLKLVAAILDIQFETVYNRDRAKRTRKRIVVSCVSVLAILVLLVTALFFTRKAIAGMMEGDMKNAIATCEVDLYSGLNELQNLEKRAVFWRLDPYSIRNVISEKISFNAGDCLRRTELGYYGYLALGTFDSFIDNNRSIIFNGEACYDIASGKKSIEFDKNGEISLYLANENVKTISLPCDSVFITHLSYDNETDTYYISVSSDANYYIASVDAISGEFRLLADDAFYKNRYGDVLYFLRDDRVFKMTMSDGGAEECTEQYNDFIIDSNGKIYWTDSENTLFGNSIKNCTDLYLSPDEKVLFVLTGDNLFYGLDAETGKTLYSYPTYGMYCTAAFSEAGVGVLYSKHSDTDIYYCCFDIKSGKVIYEKKAKEPVREEYSVEGTLFRYCALSPDGSVLAFSDDGRNVTLKRLSDGSEVITEHDNEISDIAFRCDSKALYVYCKSGVLYTWSVEDYNRFSEAFFSEFMADPENNSKALLFENGLLYKPVFGGGYEAVYGTEYSFSNIMSQTKDYFVIMADINFSEDLTEFKYLKCNKNTYEVSEIKTSLNEFPILVSCDYASNTVCDIDYDSSVINLDTEALTENKQSEQNNIPEESVEGFDCWRISENKILVAPIYNMPGNVSLVDVNTGERVLIDSAEEDDYARVYKHEEVFLIILGNVGYKYSSEGECLSQFLLPGRVVVNKKTGKKTTAYNEMIVNHDGSKVLYYDMIADRLVVVSTDNGSVIYQKCFDEYHVFTEFNRGSAFGDNHSMVFDKSGEYVFITYADTVSEADITELVNLKNGDTFMKFEGYPLGYQEYWDNSCVKISNSGEVSSLRQNRRSDKLIVSPLNIFKDREDMTLKIDGVYDFIINCQ